MRFECVLVCLLFPFLVLAQTSTGNAQSSNSNSNSQSNSQTGQLTQTSNNSTQTSTSGNSTNSGPTVTTIFSTFTTSSLGDDRVFHTITGTSTIVSTIGGSNGTNPVSPTQQPSSTSSTPPPTTAPATIDGGGKLPDGSLGAPSPGASAAGGVLGPPDSYTSAAFIQRASLLFVTLVGVVSGVMLVI